jgi:hypothetical protein
VTRRERAAQEKGGAALVKKRRTSAGKPYERGGRVKRERKPEEKNWAPAGARGGRASARVSSGME